MPSFWAVAAISIIGAGVSAYGQYQSGKQQAAIANANAKEQDRQAAAQLRTMQAQAQMQSAQTEINFKLRKAESDARKYGAEQLENQALQQDAINRNNLKKRQQEFAAMQAEQRTAIASSGVLEASGTPLDLLAETASKIQQDQEEQHFSNEAKRRTIFREADLERLGGELALQGATMDRNSGLAQAALTELTGSAQAMAMRREAEIMRMSGRAAKQAGTIGAVGTIFSGVGSALGGYKPSGGKATQPKPTYTT